MYMKKIPFLLCFLASTVAPLWSAESLPTAILRAMASPQEERPASDNILLDSLALLPTDTEMYIQLVKPGQSGWELCTLPLVKVLVCASEMEFFEDLSGVKDAALGFGVGSARMYTQLQLVLSKLHEARSIQSETWEMRMNRDNTLLQEVTAALPPRGEGGAITFVASLDAPLAERIRRFWDEKMKHCGNGNDEVFPWQGRVAGFDFRGIRLDLAASVRKARKSNEYLKEGLTSLETALEGRNLYFACAMKDDKLVAFIAEEPEKQVKLASSPAESALAALPLRYADLRLSKDVRLLGYCNAAMMAARTDGQVANMRSVLSMLADICSMKLRDKLGMESQGPVRAAFGRMTDIFSSWLRSAMPSGDMNCIVWKEGSGVRISCSQGMTRSSADWIQPLPGISLADEPDVFFYAGGTEAPETRRYCAELLECAGRLASDLAQTAPEGNAFAQWKPALDGMWRGMKEFSSGLGRSTACALSLGGSFPVELIPFMSKGMDISAEKLQQVAGLPFLRAAVYNDVTDWSKLDAGCRTILQAFQDAKLGKLGEVERVQRGEDIFFARNVALNLSPQNLFFTLMAKELTQTPNFVDYTLCPMGMVLSPDMTPSVSFSSNALVLGTSISFNKTVCRALSSPESYLKGAAFVFRAAPLVDAARRYLDAFDAEDAQSFKVLYDAFETTLNGVYAYSFERDGRMHTEIFYKTR